MANFARFRIASMAALTTVALGAGVASAERAGGPEIVLAQLSGSDRSDFIQSSIESCTSTINKNNAAVPAATVKTYCTCMAGKEADMTTQADLAYISAHKAATEEYTKRIGALAPACKAAAGLQ